MTDKLLLVDGNSIINRAFFGLGQNTRLSSPDGQPTGAVFGFLRILASQLKGENPTHLIVMFDRPEPTFRHLDFADYKAKRTGMPDELAVQMPILKTCLEALAIPQVELAGYEADDLIGTFAKTADEQGMEVRILTGDKDSYQLIRDHVQVIMPGQKTPSGYQTVDREVFGEKYGITPEQFIDVKAIMGDTSDNIPGVRGIGEKGALQLIATYGSLDAIYEHLDELKPGHRDKLIEHKEMAYKSQELATIMLDVPLEINLDEAKMAPSFNPDAKDIFRSYGFTTLIDVFGLNNLVHDQATTAAEESEDGHTQSYTFDTIAQTFTWPQEVELERSQFDTIIESVKQTKDQSPIHIAAFSGTDKEGVKAMALAYVNRPDQVLLEPYLKQEQLQEFVDLILEKDLELVGYDLKRWLRYVKVSMKMRVFDTMSASYLLSLQDHYAEESALMAAVSANQSENLSFKSLVEDVVELELETAELNDGKKAPKPTIQEEVEKTVVRSALWSTVMDQPFRAALREKQLEKLARDCDMPLVLCLAQIEFNGFLIDEAILNELNIEFSARIETLEAEIHEMAGKSFSINSPKQLGDVLFVDLGLPSGKKGKTGNYSTAQAELDRIRSMHPIIDKITDYRQLTKLRSTFIDGLTKYIDPSDGRIHSHFNQNFTNTGRLSSKDPNLQNIPVRQAVGREIRKAFVAPPGKVLLDADYSQIELRLLAELSGDKAMIEAYQKNIDIHSLTATRIFNVDLEDVTGELRSRAKTINFSIVYGISDFGLSQRLDLSVKEAHQYIENYYQGYPAVQPFMEQQIALAKKRGFSETLLGRRRYIPELSSKNRNLRQFGERVAMNSPVQGTAADIIRIAMVNCAKRLEDSGLDARLVSQVHDELIIEAAEADAKQAGIILQESMEEAVKLSVPMVAEVSSGNNWFEAK